MLRRRLPWPLMSFLADAHRRGVLRQARRRSANSGTLTSNTGSPPGVNKIQHIHAVQNGIRNLDDERHLSGGSRPHTAMLVHRARQAGLRSAVMGTTIVHAPIHARRGMRDRCTWKGRKVDGRLGRSADRI